MRAASGPQIGGSSHATHSQQEGLTTLKTYIFMTCIPDPWHQFSAQDGHLRQQLRHTGPYSPHLGFGLARLSAARTTFLQLQGCFYSNTQGFMLPLLSGRDLRIFRILFCTCTFLLKVSPPSLVKPNHRGAQNLAAGRASAGEWGRRSDSPKQKTEPTINCKIPR